MQAAFIRRLGCGAQLAHANHYSTGSDPAAVGIAYEPNSAAIELKYFRLAHTRSLKESYRFNVWQSQTFLAKMMPEGSNNEGHTGG